MAIVNKRRNFTHTYSTERRNHTLRLWVVVVRVGQTAGVVRLSLRVCRTQTMDNTVAPEQPAWVAAIDVGDLAAVQEAFATRDVNCTGLAPLHMAASRGQLSILRWLLHKGACVDALDNTGWTGAPRQSLFVTGRADTPPALHWAVRRSHVDCAYELLVAGASPSIQTPSHWTAIGWALLYDQKDAVRWLIEFGAKLSEAPEHAVSIPKWALDYVEAREKCRCAAGIVIGICQRGRSPLVRECVPDVARLIGQYVWRTRTCPEWLDKTS